MAIRTKLTDRYEVKEVLGQGGMGVVYRAYDTVIRRDIALKTIRDMPEKAALDLFHKECDVLASLSHPNIVEIFDIGEFKDDDAVKPYFVMPLLKGATLETLIRNSSQRLTVERVIDILCQSCRGLQAAHERGLVHRDLKPSNIFVLEDDSVKIIDFGVAHMADTRTVSAQKGTLLYMSPEQIQLKPASALSDIFSLGVVAYETFTLRRPFDGANHREVANAIVHRIPPPVSELNPGVNPLIARVVHKSMAKQPWHRFGTARDFAEALQKALHNQPIESFDAMRIQPRIDRASKAFDSGDYQFAAEILTELEAEGHLLPEMTPLRRKIDHAVRQKMIAQLLESARTRMDDDEHPLALQKVQEALEIDPENAQALTLREQIESNRSRFQVDEWLRLARQHMDRFAFSHARQALENVLEMRATDNRAFDLLAEVQRREQQYLQLRQEKERLYQAAMAAYEHAELSTALSKLERVLELDRRAPEIASPERGSAYQNFYNQVRSEQDANMGAYAEARRCLSEANFVRALEISEEALRKYPGQALFQALKFDIEERKRQMLSGFIAEVDRSVEAEPDLDKRVEILRSAAERFPDEPHFERSLRLMRDKRDLVGSIVAKARRMEDQAQFSEALGQWEILRTVYSQYPGLEFEMERVSKRRDQQVRNEAKANWTAQIDAHLEGGDFSHAATLLREAQVEFPGDPELEELAKLVRQGASRAGEARILVEKARGLSDQGDFERAIAILRDAYALDGRNLIVRGLLLEALLKMARTLLDSDWKRADELIQQAAQLDPSHPLIRSMAALTADRRKDAAIDQCVHRARQLQAAGDVQGALSLVEQELALQPSATRLVRLQATLQRAPADAGRAQSRGGDLERMKNLAARAKNEGQGKALRGLADEARQIAARYPADSEFQPLVESIEIRYAMVTRESATATVAAPDMAATVALDLAATTVALPSAAPAAAAAAETAVMPAVQPAPTPRPLPAAPAAIPATPAPRTDRPKLRWLWAAAAAGLVVLVGPVVVLLASHHEKPAAALVPVELRTEPPGATILVNEKVRGMSNLQLDLAAGSYKINAIKQGYRPLDTTLSLAAGRGAVSDLTLQPLPTVVRLLTNFESAPVALDGKPQNMLQGGQLILDNIAPGRHILTAGSGAAAASIRFEAREGEAPVVSQTSAGKDSSAILIANLGAVARVYASAGGKVVLDGKPAGTLESVGLELSQIAPGGHEITIEEGTEHRKVVCETGSVPALTVYLNGTSSAAAARPAGTLVVMTGEDDVKVSLDGEAQARATDHGQLRITNLDPRQYAISVAKDGFLPVPAQQAQVVKGEDTRVVFQLRPVPTVASLRLGGALPGTQVILDGAAIGTVGADGAFSLAQAAPGAHTLQLRKDDFKPKTLQVTLAAGQAFTLDGAELALESALGELDLAITPATAEISIRRSGESQARTVSGPAVRLPEGSYTISARAAHYMDSSATVQIAAGATRSVTLQLLPEVGVAAPKPKPLTRVGMEGWQDPKEWTVEGDHYLRSGGEFSLFGSTTPGMYVFSFAMKHGKQFRWVAHYIDDRNYALFELDDQNYYRKQVTNGKTTDLVRKPHGFDMHPSVQGTMLVEVSPEGVVQRIRKGNTWMVLDAWKDPALSQGKFGLLIHGHDEVMLFGFAFLHQ